MINLTLTKQEYIQFHEFSIGMRDYIRCSFDKIIFFHGSDDEHDLSINKIKLYFYYIFGYKFVCCYPKLTKQLIGFGNFIWPEYDKPIYAHISLLDNQGFSITVDLESKNNQ